MFGRKKQAESANGGRPQRKSIGAYGENKRKALEKSLKSCPSLHGANSSMKGIMKISSSKASLDAKYGSSENGENGNVDSKSIKFQHIEIREYERTLGDNPSCSSGPPISISWDYYPDVIKLKVDEYEDTRPPRRTNYEMILPRDIRQAMLRKEWGITQSQIAAAVRTNIKVKNQRRTTVNNLSKSSKLEEAFENATRKVMKSLLLKNTNKELDKLEKQAQMAQQQRKMLEDSDEMVGVAGVA